ncbi:MAG TPA: NAD(P)/FAD-dependent oxidoreductase [Candidatus Polarisedimenticolaceae bacterium]|nr:NAD(P)/FAD-dependent oxidoreductase [Candidatus Polarisedimenticolaceae bacterium]
MRTSALDAIVIGAGANGLVAASRLAKAGRRVVVLDAAPAAGGQSRLLDFAPGYRAAPLGIDPGWAPPGIVTALGLTGLEPLEHDTPLTVPTGAGAFLTLSRDAGTAAAAIASHSKADAEKWPAFTSRLHQLAGFLSVLYQSPAPDVGVASLGEVLPLLGLGRKFRALGRVGMIEFLRTLPLSVQELADDWFECGPLKAAIATAGIQDLRQGPRSGGTGFVLLHHLVGAPEGSVRGRVPFRAGPGAFTASAGASAARFGVTIRTGARVARIDVRDDAVASVVLEGGEEIAAKQVLSTADPARTFLEWVDPVWLDPEFVRTIGNIRHRGCTAYVLFALEALPEFPGLVSRGALGGTVSLTGDAAALERAADAAKYGEVSPKPHVELHVPTVHWPDLAPAGRHVLVARLQYAPHALRSGDWDPERREALARTVIGAIDRIYPGFASRIVRHTALTPKDLDEQLGLHEGSASQGELALDQILFMRPVPGWGRHATPIDGLFLGGCGTHPGPGILGGAGWLAAGRMLEENRRPA